MKFLHVLACLVITATASKAPKVKEDLFDDDITPIRKDPVFSVADDDIKSIRMTPSFSFSDDDIKIIINAQEEAHSNWAFSMYEGPSHTDEYKQKYVIENDTPGDDVIITAESSNDNPDVDTEDEEELKEMLSANPELKQKISSNPEMKEMLSANQNMKLPYGSKWFIRRKKEYKPWSPWRYWSVPYEYLFPRYNQFTPSGWRCPVGCGPVAWAMVFGYYDRLAHWAPHYGYNSHLFRCIDGLKGSASCVAPTFRNHKVNKYILGIRKEVKTFCLGGGGATTPWHMRRIHSFYKDRQGGNPRILSYYWWLSWTGWTRTWIRNRARSAIQAGYPAIVGVWVKTNKKGQHYPVATRYKSRSRKYRSCWRLFGRWRCGRWKTQTQEYFYLRMGWGGHRDGWYSIKTFSAFVAIK